MPTILRLYGFRFFYTNEHLLRHVRVEKGDDSAKFKLLIELIELRIKFSFNLN